MTVEQILNLQYRKILTKRETIKDYIKYSIISKSDIIELSNIEILSLLLIDFDNNDKEELSAKELKIIEPFINHITDNDNNKRKYNPKDIDIIKNIGYNKKINLDLNKAIAIKYAEYINLSDYIMPIGIEVIKNLY